MGYFSQPSKSQLKAFLNFIFDTFFGLCSVEYLVENVERSFLKKKPDDQFWVMLELLMTGFIRKIKGVHLSVIKDLEIKFFRTR